MKIVILTVCALALFGISIIALLRSARPLAFDSEQWQHAATEVDWPIRHRMVGDLLQRNLLAGKTRATVTETLGSPDVVESVNDRLVLYTIREDYSGIDPIYLEALEIGFDVNDTVATVKIRAWDHGEPVDPK